MLKAGGCALCTRYAGRYSPYAALVYPSWRNYSRIGMVFASICCSFFTSVRSMSIRCFNGFLQRISRVLIPLFLLRVPTRVQSSRSPYLHTATGFASAIKLPTYHRAFIRKKVSVRSVCSSASLFWKARTSGPQLLHKTNRLP